LPPTTELVSREPSVDAKVWEVLLVHALSRILTKGSRQISLCSYTKTATAVGRTYVSKPVDEQEARSSVTQPGSRDLVCEGVIVGTRADRQHTTLP
jgi:hypothetical protein